MVGGDVADADTVPSSQPVTDHRQPDVDALAGVVVADSDDSDNPDSDEKKDPTAAPKRKKRGGKRRRGAGRPRAEPVPPPPVDIGGFGMSPRKKNTATGRARRYRYWMVTVNTHDERMLERLATVVTPEGKISYLQVQKEYGQEQPDEPYAHFQCYVECRVKMSHQELNIELGCRALGFNAHCDVRRGMFDFSVCCTDRVYIRYTRGSCYVLFPFWSLFV